MIFLKSLAPNTVLELSRKRFVYCLVAVYWKDLTLIFDSSNVRTSRLSGLGTDSLALEGSQVSN